MPMLLPFVSSETTPSSDRPVVYVTDDVYVWLIRMSRGVAPSVLGRRDLGELGLDPAAEYLEARDRLARLVKARLVLCESIRGPRGSRCLTFRHDALGAACALLPGLFDHGQLATRSEALLALTVESHTLVVAPDLDDAFRGELVARFAEGRRRHLLALAPSGLAPIQEEGSLERALERSGALRSRAWRGAA